VTQAFEGLSSIYYMRRDGDVVRRVLTERLGDGDTQNAVSIEDPAFRIKSIDLDNCLADITLPIQGEAGPFRRVDINAEWLEKGLALDA